MDDETRKQMYTQEMKKENKKQRHENKSAARGPAEEATRGEEASRYQRTEGSLKHGRTGVLFGRSRGAVPARLPFCGAWFGGVLFAG